MYIFEMFEATGRRIVVTYPGRFQPFHLGHKDVFSYLQSRFGSDNVYVVTGNKTNDVDTPFNFSDKSRFMHAAGVPAHSIIEADKVYDLPEQFQANKENTIFITAVGAPDAARLRPGSMKKDGTPGYFQPLPADLNQMATADQHGYVIVADEKQDKVSVGKNTYDISHGTPIRQLWNQVRNDSKQRAEVLKKLYGQADATLGEIMDKIPTQAPEPKTKPSPKLKKVKQPEVTTETRVISKDELVDIYITGMHKGNMVKKQVGKDIPNKLVNRFIDHVSKKFNVLPSAFVYGPARKISEEAAATGVVRDGNDPRYSMATMGDQNDVTGDTLNQMMRGYNLIGKKSVGKLKPVEQHVGKGVNEARSSASVRMYRALQQAKTERERSERAGEQLYRRHQEIRKQSGLPDPAYYKELEKIYLANLSDQEHMQAVKELQQKYGLQEGWKSKLGAAALAGAAALSPAPAQADAWDTVMEPVRKVQKFQRDIGNFGRNIEHDVSGVRNRVGRDLEQIPIGGIDQVGRAIRGSTNHQQLQRDPAWDARVQAAKEKQARDQAEREYRMQQDAERYNSDSDASGNRDRNRWGASGMNESSAGATGAGAIATGINSSNGFGWSVFYKQNQKKKKAKSA
jgi:vacuolar-type H+-ATPase subunit H